MLHLQLSSFRFPQSFAASLLPSVCYFPSIRHPLTVELVSLLAVLIGKVEGPSASISLFDSTTAVVAPGASDIRVPDTVIAGSPGTSVWPATRNWDSEFAVKVSPPRVRTNAVGLEGSGTVDEPTTR